jgi:hypothetical protein
MDKEDSIWGNETPEDPPDPWFRPVWDETDATEDVPPGRSPKPPPRPRAIAVGHPPGDPNVLLAALASAADALARLDAQATQLTPALQEGLRCRLAYAASQLVRTQLPHPLGISNSAHWAAKRWILDMLA